MSQKSLISKIWRTYNRQPWHTLVVSLDSCADQRSDWGKKASVTLIYPGHLCTCTVVFVKTNFQKFSHQKINCIFVMCYPFKLPTSFWLHVLHLISLHGMRHWVSYVQQEPDPINDINIMIKNFSSQTLSKRGAVLKVTLHNKTSCISPS